ncbi:cyclin-domain-containing protein [Hysterangium stoloniferum]|nr:cyclin-domain-containing protein [Hysterangium stoloniferum]
MEEEPVASAPPSVASSHWFWVGPHPSSQAIAEKTCEMVCYLWFSNTLGTPPKSSPFSRACRRTRAGHSPQDPLTGLSDASTAALQFTPSPQFVHFMQKLLQTTQVSQSVIVLALHYVYRLKEENHFTNGQAGSEFRVAVVALMLANKFVDDNTYTNKTWSDVSGIELTEINKMEREFLRGVDFRLYINTDTYKAWVNLLKGLVAAKERDEQQWHYSRRHSAANVYAPVARMPVPNLAMRQQPRARSSSPLPSLKASYPFTFNVPPTFSNPFAETENLQSREPVQPSAKRPAVVAFSPPSAALEGPPSKRPISLDMSSVRNMEGPASAGTSYPLHAFAKLSLNKSDTPSRSSPAKLRRHVDAPQTLAAAYNVQDRVAGSDPQNLYYYALASSPTHTEEDVRVRKALLRSHQPTYYPSVPTYLQAPPPQPMYIQSANASPLHPLPSFRYLQPHHSHFDQYSYFNTDANYRSNLSFPPTRLQAEAGGPPAQPDYAPPPQTQGNRVLVAPFANAGPPGVQWASQQPYSHAYLHARYASPQV